MVYKKQTTFGLFGRNSCPGETIIVTTIMVIIGSSTWSNGLETEEEEVPDHVLVVVVQPAKVIMILFMIIMITMIITIMLIMIIMMTMITIIPKMITMMKLTNDNRADPDNHNNQNDTEKTRRERTKIWICHAILNHPE